MEIKLIVSPFMVKTQAAITTATLPTPGASDTGSPEYGPSGAAGPARAYPANPKDRKARDGEVDVKEFEEQGAPRWAKRSLSLGAILLFAAGLFAGLLLGEFLAGVFLFALGVILYAMRGYLNTGDKAVAGALIFVALVAMGIEAIVHFLGP